MTPAPSRFLATEAPDSPHLTAGNITAELYFGHADQDETLTPEQIDAPAADQNVLSRCEVLASVSYIDRKSVV